jgi:hypothetical protein
MTNHDLISSYIDNELSREQEQEFLIKLAANDNLRNSFRTELTLKNIVQRDESLITPPRALRASIFAAIGLSGVEAVTAATSVAAASQSGSFFRTLFATKLNTAFTTLGLSVATLFGYVGHDMLKDESVAPVQTEQPVLQPAATNQPVSNSIERVATPAQKPVAQSAVKTRIRSTASQAKAPATLENSASQIEAPPSDNPSSSESSVFGSGEGEMAPPTVIDPSETK